MDAIKEHVFAYWKSYSVVGIVIILLFIAFIFTSPKEEQTFEHFTQETIESTEQEDVSSVDEKIVIDIKGQVKNPGVYEMVEGDRLIDAIKKAGGVLPSAATASLNYATRLQDEMLIYVPTEEEVEAEKENEATNTSTERPLVNINEATKEQLMTIPGIGPAKAEAIMQYREEISFRQKEEIMNVSGIGEKTFENISPYFDVK